MTYMYMRFAAQASSSIVQSSVDLEVYLLNDKKVTLAVKPFLNTDEILELVCEKIELPSDLTYYFSLCLDEQNDDKWTCTYVHKCMSYVHHDM